MILYFNKASPVLLKQKGLITKKESIEKDSLKESTENDSL